MQFFASGSSGTSYQDEFISTFLSFFPFFFYIRLLYLNFVDDLEYQFSGVMCVSWGGELYKIFFRSLSSSRSPRTGSKSAGPIPLKNLLTKVVSVEMRTYQMLTCRERGRVKIPGSLLLTNSTQKSRAFLTGSHCSRDQKQTAVDLLRGMGTGSKLIWSMDPYLKYAIM